MNRNPINTQDNLNNIRDEERTIPEIERDINQEFAELDRLLEFTKNPSSNSLLNKPLGSAGDITINELISKGLDVIDTPLVQMIRENVEESVVWGFIFAMILYKMYKTIVNLYIKATDGNNEIEGTGSVRKNEIEGRRDKLR